MGNECSTDSDDIMPLRRNRGKQSSATYRRPAAADTTSAMMGASSSGEPLPPLMPQATLTAVKDRRELTSQDLLRAAMLGDTRLAVWSLQAEGDPNVTTVPTQLQPLHLSAAQGHVTVTRVLLQLTADPSSVNNQLGMTALSMACLAGHKDVVQVLVSVSAPVSAVEGDGSTPMLRATARNFSTVVEVLLHAGADVNVALRSSTSTLHRSAVSAEASDEQLTSLKVDGAVPLHFAAWHGNTRVCQQLLAACARATAVDGLGRSPLMHAGQAGHTEVMLLLLEASARVSVSADGQTVASLATRAGHAPILRLLIEHCVVDVNYAASDREATMLHDAVRHGHSGCAALLCTLSADIGAPLEPEGLRPLMLAAARGLSDVCRELLARKAAVNEVDVLGRTAWLHAAQAGHAEICELLVGGGAVEQCSSLDASIG